MSLPRKEAGIPTPVRINATEVYPTSEANRRPEWLTDFGPRVRHKLRACPGMHEYKIDNEVELSWEMPE